MQNIRYARIEFETVKAHDLPRIKALIDPMRSFRTRLTLPLATKRSAMDVSRMRIGKYMEGGDSDDTLYNAKSYVSVRKGSLGSSLRGKSPIQDLVPVKSSVLFPLTLERLESWLNFYNKLTFGFPIAALCCWCCCAACHARCILKADA